MRLSNRFAGPMLRLRRSLRALGRGEYVEPLEFRGADFWQEFADDFNSVLRRVQAVQTPPSSPSSAEQPEEEPATAGVE